MRKIKTYQPQKAFLACFLLIQGLVISSCGQQKNQPELKSQVVTMEPVTETETIIADSLALTCIILKGDSIYCYRGKDLKTGQFYSFNGENKLSSYISRTKRQVGNNLMIIIKPGKQATTKDVINILDEMKLNGIKNYAMVKLLAIEAGFLHTNDYDFTPTEPVSIETPKSVNSQLIPDDNAFVIEIKEDSSVWYQPLSLTSRMIQQQVQKPVTANLQKIIADYEAGHTGIKISYLIKGHKKTTYPVFEEVINALKNNNIFKYNLVTSED